MKNSNVRTIIFDFGGVLLSNDDIQEIGRYLAEKYHVNAETLNKVILEGWFHARVDSNYDAAFWKGVSDALGISPMLLVDEFIQFPQPIPETIKIAQSLKQIIHSPCSQTRSSLGISP